MDTLVTTSRFRSATRADQPALGLERLAEDEKKLAQLLPRPGVGRDEFLDAGRRHGPRAARQRGPLDRLPQAGIRAPQSLRDLRNLEIPFRKMLAQALEQRDDRRSCDPDPAMRRPCAARPSACRRPRVMRRQRSRERLYQSSAVLGTPVNSCSIRPRSS